MKKLLLLLVAGTISVASCTLEARYYNITCKCTNDPEYITYSTKTDGTPQEIEKKCTERCKDKGGVSFCGGCPGSRMY